MDIKPYCDRLAEKPLTTQSDDKLLLQTSNSDDCSNPEANLNEINKKIKINQIKEKITQQECRTYDPQFQIVQQEENIPNKDIISEVSEKILSREFFTVDPVTLSKSLIGKILVRRIGNQVIKARIVETEAYNAKDMTSHVRHGKVNENTKSLYLEGGHLYMALIHGTSCCLSITATVKDDPTACLLRAVEIIEGYDLAVVNRNMKNPSKTGKELTNGPGKLCAALKIDKNLNYYDITVPGELYIIEGDGSPFDMVVSKRINIEYAGEDKHKPWRFYIKNNVFVSVKGEILDTIVSTDPKLEKEVVKNKTANSVIDLDKFRFGK